MLIFDLTSSCQTHVLPLLLRSPHPMHVGLDTERNGAELISGEPARSKALARIAAIVERGN